MSTLHRWTICPKAYRKRNHHVRVAQLPPRAIWSRALQGFSGIYSIILVYVMYLPIGSDFRVQDHVSTYIVWHLRALINLKCRIFKSSVCSLKLRYVGS